MANLTETNTYTSGVYQLERTDPVDAGVSGSGLANLQAVQLASRTNYLKTVLDAVGLNLSNTSLQIPALAIASLPPASSNTRKLFFATDANAGAGVIVVSNGTNWIDLRTGATVTTAATTTVANASDVLAGIVQLATNAEAITGTNPTKAVTPAALQAKINAIPSLGAATTSTAGTVILATNGEALTGTDPAKSITPAALQAKISAIPSATTSTAGLVPLATSGEALTGSDTTKAITAAALQAKVNAIPATPAASTSVAGIIQVATPAQVQALTVNDRTITPLALAGLIPSMSAAQGQFAQINAAGNAFSYTLENTAVIVAVSGSTYTALPNRYLFFQAACTVTLPVTPPAGTFIAFYNSQDSGTITISASGTNANGATLPANARGYLVYAGSNWRNMGFTGGAFVAVGSSVAFDFTGANQSCTVPAGVTTATPTLWGAGGGGAAGGFISGPSGGGGGFCQATIAVTAGEILTIIVGKAGSSQVGRATGASFGGGLGSASGLGSGGGRSAVLRGATELLTAGGGGGAGVGGGAGGAGPVTGGSFPAGGSVGGSTGGAGGTSFVVTGATSSSTAAASGASPPNNDFASYIRGIAAGGISSDKGSTLGGDSRATILWG